VDVHVEVTRFPTLVLSSLVNSPRNTRWLRLCARAEWLRVARANRTGRHQRNLDNPELRPTDGAPMAHRRSTSW